LGLIREKRKPNPPAQTNRCGREYQPTSSEPAPSHQLFGIGAVAEGRFLKAEESFQHDRSKVQQFLERHSNVKLHFTPTYSSWLNQVEIWFARLEREVIARGIFTSVKDLARKLMRYIRAYSKTARPFKWKYTMSVAVGTAIADRPPHRSVCAELPHTAPA
jgi:hypothetical protein